MIPRWRPRFVACCPDEVAIAASAARVLTCSDVATCPTCRKAFAAATFCPQDGSRLVDHTMDGSVVLDNRYRLIRQVGAGGMGEVYEAEHVHIHRKVAVKILRPEIASNTEAIARLKQEAQTTSGLGHPNIVDTLDFGISDGQSYLVMEWLDGESLDRRLSRGPVDIATALEIVAQAAGGLAEAHARGVIHRDLKPANLLLTTDRNGAMLVKVVDFGIAKLAASQSSLTAAGVLVGTPSYMAPEQAMGEPIDERTDVYALGVILYELVTGHPPFRAETPLAVLHQHTSKMPVPPTESSADRGISVEVEAIVMRCLAKAPGQRFASMTELVRAIDEVRGYARSAPTPSAVALPVQPREPTRETAPELEAADDHEPPRRRRTGILVAIALAVVVAAAVMVFVFMRGREQQSSGENAVATATDDARGAMAADTPDAAIDEGAGRIAGMMDAVNTSVDAGADRVAGVTVDANYGAVDAQRSTDAAVIAWRHDGRAQRFAFAATSPTTPAQDEPFRLTVMLEELSDALAAKSLRARVSLEYFRDHSVAYAELHDVKDRQFSANVTVRRAGKHHVRIELLDGAQRVDVARFDIVFAPP